MDELRVVGVDLEDGVMMVHPEDGVLVIMS